MKLKMSMVLLIFFGFFSSFLAKIYNINENYSGFIRNGSILFPFVDLFEVFLDIQNSFEQNVHVIFLSNITCNRSLVHDFALVLE